MSTWAHAWDLERVFSYVSTSPTVPGQAISKVELRKVWHALCSNLSECLLRQRGVTIPTFGTFTMYKKDVRDQVLHVQCCVHSLPIQPLSCCPFLTPPLL